MVFVHQSDCTGIARYGNYACFHKFGGGCFVHIADQGHIVDEYADRASFQESAFHFAFHLPCQFVFGIELGIGEKFAVLDADVFPLAYYTIPVVLI